MTILVIFGLQAWHAIMDPQDDHDILVEVTGKQFDWTFRYPGEDGKLGLRDYNLISQTGNKLGLVSEKWIAVSYTHLRAHET